MPCRLQMRRPGGSSRVQAEREGVRRAVLVCDTKLKLKTDDHVLHPALRWMLVRTRPVVQRPVPHFAFSVHGIIGAELVRNVDACQCAATTVKANNRRFRYPTRINTTPPTSPSPSLPLPCLAPSTDSAHVPPILAM